LLFYYLKGAKPTQPRPELGHVFFPMCSFPVMIINMRFLIFVRYSSPA